jgi:hypothetical protein
MELVGTMFAVVGQLKQGKAAKAAGKYQNALAEKRADEERAVASKKSQEMTSRGRLAVSRARAVGAASGGGLDYDLMGDLSEEGTRNSLNAIWEGENAAVNSEAQGAGAIYEGNMKNQASKFKAVTTLLSAADEMKKYAPS